MSKSDLSNSKSTDLPPISALFLIYFDIKAGYTIAWKRSLPGIELDGVVEYKSLPSGLHNVTQDLVYWIYDDHAGLSAFLNLPAGEESRNARMIAVGIMVPLSYGRLGRSWKYAKQLEEITRELIVDTTKTEILAEFWEKHKAHEVPSQGELDPSFEFPTVQHQAIQTAKKEPKGPGRDRSASDGATLSPTGQHLSAYHPAWSLTHLLDTFGPLIFPIYRTALLRKRILISAHTPVEETCNFVYNLSVLANLPAAILDLLVASAPSQRLRPLFSIGVHDIPLLEENLRASTAAANTAVSEGTGNSEDLGFGWIACTTDSILAVKSSLYDVLVTLPPTYSDRATGKVWPKLEYPSGVELKATQRDLRRYKALRRGLYHQHCQHPSPRHSCTDPLNPERNSIPATSHALLREDSMIDTRDIENIVEATSWSALAYTGFMWWASAGEQRLHSEEESEIDVKLLSGLLPSSSAQQRPGISPLSGIKQRHEGQATQEMAIIAYFRRLTTQILTTLSNIANKSDPDSERDDSELLETEANRPAFHVSNADMERMGLDIWSVNDHLFVQDIAREYFGFEARLDDGTVDVCGIRIC